MKATFEQGQIIIRRRGLSLKYRVLRTQFTGDVEVLWALRAKLRDGIWVTFGREKALLPFQYRQLEPDDFHYFTKIKE